MVLAQSNIGASVFDFLIIVIAGWILIALWQRSLDTFFYNEIGLNINSSSHTFLVALFITFMFINFFYFFDDIASTLNIKQYSNLSEDTLSDLKLYSPLHSRF